MESLNESKSQIRANPLKSPVRWMLILLLLSVGTSCFIFYGKFGAKAQSRTFINRDHPPPTTQIIYAPTRGLTPSSQSELVLNNNSPDAMLVTPTLYSKEGQPSEGAQIALKPLEVRRIPMSKLTPGSLRGGKDGGGVSLSYFGGMLEVGAQLTLFGEGRAGSVDIPFSGAGDYKSNIQEAVWWSPSGAETTLAMGNTSDSSIQVKLLLANGEQHFIEISPFATEVFTRKNQFQTSKGNVESIRLELTGPVGSLRTVGYVRSANKNYASMIRFYDPQKQRQANLYATNLRLDNSIPSLVLKNISDSSISVQPRFRSSKGEEAGPLELPSLSLEAHEARAVDLAPLIEAASSRDDFHMLSVEVINSGAAGSLIGALASSDRETSLTYEVPLRDSGPVRSSTGSYPWRLDEDYTTLVTVTNISLKQALFTVLISYPGGEYALDPQKLKPGATAVFDLNQIQQEQIPDRSGQTIPREVKEGQFVWSVFHGRNQVKLIGRMQIISKTNRVSMSYSCELCCPWSIYQASLSATQVSIGVGGTGNVQSSERDINCFGGLGPYYLVTADWGIGDQGVATVSPTTSNTTTVTGVGGGSTQVDSVWTGEHWFFNSSFDDCDMDPVPVFMVADVAVIVVDNVTAVNGIKVNSAVGNQNFIHFVTPKGTTGQVVTLTATITPGDQNSINQITWEGATQDASNKLKATVPKNVADRKIVKIKVGTTVIKELRVWIVWATISASVIPIQYNEPRIVNTSVGAELKGGYDFTHTIQPASIITDSNRPDFSGANIEDGILISPPGGNHPVFGDPLANGADRKWDSSRQVRTKIVNPNNIPVSARAQPPISGTIAYPTNDVEGNDDRGTADETNDPYSDNGELTGADAPNEGVEHSSGVNGNTFELRLHFREFARLEIAGTWYRISDYQLWRVHLKFIRTTGVWVNNSSVLALDNNGF
jgi:hypothetical protein